MINLAVENLISFAEAARRLPRSRGEKPVSPSTVWRWATSGCKSVSGVMVKLDSCRIGGRSVTSIEAIQRFSTALSDNTQPQQHADESEPTSRTPAQRLAASQRAGDRLAATGM